MFQNVKVDVLYYQINTDFEMEFNLCGCCRMRLLTEKATDRKSLAHFLARAVSRSRVILVCGSLFGSDGLIETVARSVNRPLVVADAAAYGLDSDTEVKIMEGATPLVSPEGYFGGCIIESGPQAIILLTDNKHVRKSIMENLIHSYVAELSMIPENQPTATEEPEETLEETLEETAEEVVEETAEEVAEELAQTEEGAEEIASETEESSEESDQESEDAPEETVQEPIFETAAEEETPEAPQEEAPIITGGPAEEPQETEVPLDLYIDAQNEEGENEDLSKPLLSFSKHEKRSREYYTEEYVLSEKEDYFCGEDGLDDEGKPAFRLPILILTIVLLIALAALAYLLIYLPMRDGMSLGEYLKTIFGLTARVSLLPKF